MRTYKARFETEAVERDDGWIIGPEHEEEWAEYQAWLAEGNKPSDPDPLPSPPTIQDKLASVGLSIDELKEALGLS